MSPDLEMPLAKGLRCRFWESFGQNAVLGKQLASRGNKTTVEGKKMLCRKPGLVVIPVDSRAFGLGDGGGDRDCSSVISGCRGRSSRVGAAKMAPRVYDLSCHLILGEGEE